jgi:hypothetical protein
LPARTDPEIVLRIRDVQFLEKDLAHLIIIMLPCVNDQMLVSFGQLPMHGRYLYELGPSANDREELHALRIAHRVITVSRKGSG